MKIYEELKKRENKKAFRELVMKYHPDRGGDEDVMKKLTNAADKGDKAFEDFRDELLGKKKPARKKYDTGVHKNKNEGKWVNEFAEMLYDEIKSMEEVNGIRGLNRKVGHETPFFVDLKDGRHLQISYIEAPSSPSISVWMISKKNEPMEWKMAGDKWRGSLVARSVESAKNGIKNIIKAKEFRVDDEEDPWEETERETYRDSRRGR